MENQMKVEKMSKGLESEALCRCVAIAASNCAMAFWIKTSYKKSVMFVALKYYSSIVNTQTLVFTVHVFAYSGF